MTTCIILLKQTLVVENSGDCDLFSSLSLTYEGALTYSDNKHAFWDSVHHSLANGSIIMQYGTDEHQRVIMSNQILQLQYIFLREMGRAN